MPAGANGSHAAAAAARERYDEAPTKGVANGEARMRRRLGGESLVIDVESVIAIQRRGEQCVIHTTGGPIEVSEEIAHRVRLSWDKLPRR